MKRQSLTRRGFIGVGAGVAAAAATVAVLPGCTNNAGEAISDSPVVLPEGEAIDVTESFTEVDLTLEIKDAFDLPLGSVLHEAEGNWIPVTSMGSTATPVCFGSTLSLASGNLYELLPQAITKSSNMVIYDVRCSDKVFAWIELNTVTRDWVLYAQSFEDGELKGEINALWQADSNWDPPGFAVSGTAVVWQVRPSLLGDKTSESSFAYLWRLGSKNAKAVVESPGRFAFSPSISDGIVVLAPRVLPESGLYYGVTAYSLNDDLSSVVDQLVFPQGVRPFQGVRIGGRLVVSVEANYDTGGLLGNMGTYIKMGSNDFIRMAREPISGICGQGDEIIIKSRASYFVVNVAEKSYSFLAASDRCVDYGEYPARSGECSSFVTFATIKDTGEGYPSSVAVRNFDFSR